MKIKRKRFYKWRQPCFGFYLQGAVKSLAVVDIGIELALVVIQTVATLDPSFLQAWQTGKELDLIKYYARPVHWLYYFIYFFSNIGLSAKLYEYASERKLSSLKRYFKVSLILFLPWMTFFLSHIFWIQFENKRGLSTFAGFSLYKLYSFWLVSSFIKEIQFYGELNGEITRLVDKDIESFFEGTPKIGPDSGHPFTKQPHRKEVEIGLGQLVLDWNRPLGSGAFGQVLRAKLLRAEGDPFNHGEFTVVAVKTVDPKADIVYFKALLSELKILSYIGRHEHIVNLLGACTSQLKDRKIYVVVEFCQLGSVHNYLRANRCIFDQTSGSGYVGTNLMAVPTTRDLVKWSMQTASGMEYISSKGVIHGDLASRNILLTGERDVKIADFGLSRQLYHYSVYTKHNSEPMPWRWMAPECLCDLTFSTKSDVWSYGITLYEFYSCGETPYPGMTYGIDFISRLRPTDDLLPLRNSQPPYATKEIYDVMCRCWDNNPEARPSFKELVNVFSVLMDKFQSNK